VPRKYPTLLLREIIEILKCFGFAPQARRGTSHEQWKKVYKEATYTVTVDHSIDEFDDTLLKIIIHEQAKIPREAFYSGCKSAAAKIGVTPRRCD
jgi:predicted RNA binding protein YcfA (HicA-like mRNA interferase family)